jgi:peroxiredoxin
MPEDVKGLKAGEQAPDFELHDSTGALRSLKELVAAGPRAFVFYRGHW